MNKQKVALATGTLATRTLATGTLATGTLVMVMVQRVLPFGLLVKFAEQQRGIIRERELSWLVENGRFPNPHYTIGQQLEAVVLGQRNDGIYELSQRLAHADPWQTVASRYRPGQRVMGTVTGIQPYGVFVELELDVTGLLHRSRLPDWVQGELTDLFWPGDQVQVVIASIQVRRRRLQLNLAEAIGQRWQTAVSPPSPPPTNHSPDFHSPFIDLPLELLLQQTQTFSIGIIEDDPVQRNALKQWLERVNQRVVAFACGESALAALEKRPLDIVITDIGLPGMDGLAVMDEIIRCYPQTHGVIMTDWARASDYPSEMARLRAAGVSLLIKPLLPEDLLLILLGIEEKPQTLPAENRLPLSLTAAKPPITSALTQALGQPLARLAALPGVNKVVLFGLDGAQRLVSVVAEAGKPRLRPEAVADLIYSPVRDVAEDGVWLRLLDVEQTGARLRYLRLLLPFGSCLGVPVALDGGAMTYGLFLFGGQVGGLTAVADETLHFASETIAALLGHQQLQTQTIEMQRLALLGNLTRALVHEVNHQLSPISFALEDLHYQCNALQKALGQPEAAHELAQAGKQLTHLSQGVRNLVKTARLFSQVTIKGQSQLLRLDDLVTEAVEMVRDTADRAHVTLQLDPSPSLMVTRAQVAQVQQMLLNLLLNAIQQIASVRPETGGRVRVWLQMKERQQQPMIMIFVEDDGPGIHRGLWERIFELGFTRGREDGSGLGLYITRSLTAALGGRVYVAESYVLWGSTFALELPLMI